MHLTWCKEEEGVSSGTTDTTSYCRIAVPGGIHVDHDRLALADVIRELSCRSVKSCDIKVHELLTNECCCLKNKSV